jgi:hypothetical protein
MLVIGIEVSCFMSSDSAYSIGDSAKSVDAFPWRGAGCHSVRDLTSSLAAWETVRHCLKRETGITTEFQRFQHAEPVAGVHRIIDDLHGLAVTHPGIRNGKSVITK